MAVTNRHLCPGNFLEQVERIAAAKPHAIVLREKDMAEDAFYHLAKECRDICSSIGTPLIVNSFVEVARELGIPGVHLSMQGFQERLGQFSGLERVGVSVHSVQEARLAAKNGANYLIAGHIFATDSKKGLPPRGLAFLSDLCNAVNLPVFAIGGISPENTPDVLKTGAAGVCAMSGLMCAGDPGEVVNHYNKIMMSR